MGCLCRRVRRTSRRHRQRDHRSAQNIALGGRNVWVIVAIVVTVAAALAMAWACGTRAARAIVAWTLAWWLGQEHIVIAGLLGIVFGTATSPAVRRILRNERALSSVG